MINNSSDSDCQNMQYNLMKLIEQKEGLARFEVEKFYISLLCLETKKL